MDAVRGNSQGCRDTSDRGALQGQSCDPSLEGWPVRLSTQCVLPEPVRRRRLRTLEGRRARELVMGRFELALRQTSGDSFWSRIRRSVQLKYAHPWCQTPLKGWVALEVRALHPLPNKLRMSR